jgi:hypothetical protein
MVAPLPIPVADLIVGKVLERQSVCIETGVGERADRARNQLVAMRPMPILRRLLRVALI